MIIAEKTRGQLQEKMSEAEFKAALGLEMTVFRAEKQHIARITQLVNKTNQFNLTTLRRSPDEMDALASSKSHLVLGMALKDKYGDYGLVGVAILEKKNETCVIDTLLMSCRVLGRDAETAFIAELAAAAQKLGCGRLEGRYLPTDKNGIVADLYKTHGFVFDKTKDSWTARLSTVPKPPAHTKITLAL